MSLNRAQQARERAQIIMQVCSGKISATEGSKQLGISRKTYYEWEKRGLSALLHGLTDGEAGRPPTPVDAQTQAMEERVKELEKELAVAKETIEVKRLLDAYHQQQKQAQSDTGSTGKKTTDQGSNDPFRFRHGYQFIKQVPVTKEPHLHCTWYRSVKLASLAEPHENRGAAGATSRSAQSGICGYRGHYS